MGKFVDEMKKFENKQKSEDNFTKTLKESMKKVIAGSEETERYVNETLKRLL